MLIQQKYIQNVQSHLGNIDNDSKIIIGIRDAMDYQDKLALMGFSKEFVPNLTILPNQKIGKFCLFNAEGKYIKLKNLPKETAYRQVEWTRIEFRGRYDTEEVTDIVDIPYQRYRRRFIPPPSIEFSLVSNNGNVLVVSPTFNYTEENFDTIKTAINVMLEIFGFCEVFTNDLDSINTIKTVRVNWEILPQGEYPWERVVEIIEPLLRTVKPKIRPVITDRIKTIEKYHPSERVQGLGGFKGYLVYGFPKKTIHIFESTQYGNATYVFENSWEELSKLSKAQILDEHLQSARIIHQAGWHNEINELLK